MPVTRHGFFNTRKKMENAKIKVGFTEYNFGELKDLSKDQFEKRNEFKDKPAKHIEAAWQMIQIAKSNLNAIGNNKPEKGSGSGNARVSNAANSKGSGANGADTEA